LSYLKSFLTPESRGTHEWKKVRKAKWRPAATCRDVKMAISIARWDRFYAQLSCAQLKTGRDNFRPDKNMENGDFEKVGVYKGGGM